MEMMISIFLLSIVSGTIIYNGGRAFQERRFMNACETLRSEVALTRVLSLNYNLDVDLLLKQKGEDLFLVREGYGVPSIVEPLFFQSVRLPRAALKEGGREQIFHFYGNGWIDGKEKIFIVMSNNSKKEYTLNVHCPYS